MKILNTYKQDISTWFEYYCLFQYVEPSGPSGLYRYKEHGQHTITNWMRTIPSITMRVKYEDK